MRRILPAPLPSVHVVTGTLVDICFAAADRAHQKKERAKARELRKSQWWRQQLGAKLCHYCKQPFPPSQLTMDHRIPIVRGGVSTKKNVVVACKACNQDKKYYLPAEQVFQQQVEDKP